MSLSSRWLMLFAPELLWSWRICWLSLLKPYKDELDPFSSETGVRPLAFAFAVCVHFDTSNRISYCPPYNAACVSDGVSLCNMETIWPIEGRLVLAIWVHMRAILITLCTSSSSSALLNCISGSTNSRSLFAWCSFHACKDDDDDHVLVNHKVLHPHDYIIRNNALDNNSF